METITSISRSYFLCAFLFYFFRNERLNRTFCLLFFYGVLTNKSIAVVTTHRCERLLKECSNQIHRPRKKRQAKPS